MTNQQYKTRCGQLRKLIKSAPNNALSLQSGPFARVYRQGTTYIFNTNSHNIIYKYRIGRLDGVPLLGIQYRATSIYRPVLERVKPLVSVKARRVASPLMRRYSRPIRVLAERATESI